MGQQRPIQGRSRLIVVSNRLPVAFKRAPSGEWTAQPGSGGLVTALLPVLRDRGGTWIGWPGAAGEERGFAPALEAAGAEAGYALAAVPLDAEEVRDFYLGFSNEVVWPLFHDLTSLCNFDPRYWDVYRDVNRKYANTGTTHTRIRTLSCTTAYVSVVAPRTAVSLGYSRQGHAIQTK